jgi:hypothetical protein
MELRRAVRQQQLITRHCRRCRMLAKLPHLLELHLLEPTVPATIPSAPPLHLRPLLPSLTHVTLSPGSMAALHMLARWTRVSDGGIMLHAEGDVTTRTTAVRGWSVGWLRTVLMLSNVLFKREAVFLHPAGYALVDDSDVDTLGDALAGLDSSWEDLGLQVCLGQDVTPACLERFPAPPNLYVMDFQREDMASHVREWSESLKFTSAHFQALVRPELKELMVENCHLVGDQDIAALARGSPGLRTLHLESVERLGNSALWALCAGCRQLQAVELHGMLEVTAAGVLPLLTTAQSLRKLTVGLALRAEFSTSNFVAALRGVYPELDDVWDLQLLQNTVWKRLMKFTRVVQ